MSDTNTRRYRKPLRVLIRPDGAVDLLIGDLAGQFLAMVIGHDRQHKVDRGRPARRGHPVAINHEDRFGQFEPTDIIYGNLVDSIR